MTKTGNGNGRYFLGRICLCFLWIVLGGMIFVESYQIPLSGILQVSGTFGELRPDHFHSGLDLKTGGEEGKPVFSMDDGYVYRIKVSPFGLGKALFIRHPNGMYSVYGHLSKFNKAIEEIVFQKQFVFKKYEQEIYLPADQLLVKKGEVVAFSGNTGNSFGPHLHFEIRDANNAALDPLRFFPLAISDHISPLIQRIAVEPILPGSLVNGRFEKQEITLHGNGPEYRIEETIFVNGAIGIEYQGYDRADETQNKLGINFSKLFLDDSLRFAFSLEHFEFSDRKFINVHCDYSRHFETGRRFERCYVENGNDLDAYPQTHFPAIITLPDLNPHDFKIEFRDRAGNLSVVNGKLQEAKREKPQVIENEEKESFLLISTHRKQLLIRVQHPQKQHLKGLTVEFKKGSPLLVLPAYSVPGELVFLYDLRNGEIPVSIWDETTGRREKIFITDLIQPFRNTIIEQEGVKIFFPFKCVFDTVPLFLRNEGRNRNGFSGIFMIGDERIPLLNSFILNIMPLPGVMPDNLVIGRRTGLDKWEYVGGQKSEDGSIVASVGRFGRFSLLRDDQPPTISADNFKPDGTLPTSQKRIVFKTGDDFSGIDPGKIMMTVDGSWVLAEFDAKSGSIVWEWKSRPLQGKHFIGLTVYDRAGNNSQANYMINF